MTITLVGAGLVYVAGQPDGEKQKRRYDGVNCCVEKFCEGA